MQRVNSVTEIRLQQVVMDTNPGYFQSKLNELLLDGWRVVPGTFAVCSLEVVARPDTVADFVTAGGTTFRKQFFVAIERVEYREESACA